MVLSSLNASDVIVYSVQKQQMKGYHKVASLSAMQHRGDDSIVDDEPEGLGESGSQIFCNPFDWVYT